MEEAIIGRKGERFLIHIINTNQKFAKDLRDCVEKLTGTRLEGKIVAKPGQSLHLWKTDIILEDEKGNKIGISLKTVRKGGRIDDHLDRRWLDKPGRHAKPWTAILNMPDDIKNALQRGIVEKARNKSLPLVDPRYQQRVKDFFIKNAGVFVEEAFRNNERSLSIFAVLEYNDRLLLHLFSMEDIIKFVIDDIQRNGITFGSRINLGNYLQLQRKAGDGKHVKIPKTDPRHPGNQLQVKVLTRRLRDDAIKHNIRSCYFELEGSKI